MESTVLSPVFSRIPQGVLTRKVKEQKIAGFPQDVSLENGTLESMIKDMRRNRAENSERGSHKRMEEARMKIAFDVDVLAKQMPIRDYVRKVAGWGYKYIEQSPHPRINPFYKHPLFSKECEEEYRKALKETGVEISSFIVVYRWSGPTEIGRAHV